MSDHTLPEKILLSGEEERWQTVIRILQEISSGMQGMKNDIAGLVRDQRDATREHSRLEDEIAEMRAEIKELRGTVKQLERDRDDAALTIKIGKFLLGSGGVAGLIAWFKGLGGHQ